MVDVRFINPLTILSSIGGISIDVSNRVGENYDSIITQNPIEDGSPTTDHITSLPPRITIEGGFSDVRITNLAGPSVTQQAIRGLAKTQFDRLLELKLTRQTFNVVDGFHLFKDMQFKSLQLQKDRPGFSIFFTAELWNIVKVVIDSNLAELANEDDYFNRLRVAPQLELSVGAITVNPSLQAIGVLL